MEHSLQQQKESFGFQDSDVDDLRRLISDTNVYLLIVTLLASALHLLFEVSYDGCLKRQNSKIAALSSRAVRVCSVRLLSLPLSFAELPLCAPPTCSSLSPHLLLNHLRSPSSLLPLAPLSDSRFPPPPFAAYLVTHPASVLGLQVGRGLLAAQQEPPGSVRAHPVYGGVLPDHHPAVAHRGGCLPSCHGPGGSRSSDSGKRRVPEILPRASAGRILGLFDRFVVVCCPARFCEAFGIRKNGNCKGPWCVHACVCVNDNINESRKRSTREGRKKGKQNNGRAIIGIVRRASMPPSALYPWLRTRFPVASTNARPPLPPFRKQNTDLESAKSHGDADRVGRDRLYTPRQSRRA